MFNTPETLNIGGHIVQLRIGFMDEALKRTGCLGEFNTEKLTIDVRGDLHPTLTLQVIVHESLHALFTIGTEDKLDKELEEKICRSLENPLYRYLIENDLRFLKSVAQG